MTWLRNKGENEACESVAMGMSAHGRYDDIAKNAFPGNK